jgi:hypothetical protein
LEFVFEVKVEVILLLAKVLKGEDSSFKLGGTVKYAETIGCQRCRISFEILDKHIDYASVSLKHSEMKSHIASMRFLIMNKIRLCLLIVLKELLQVEQNLF